MLQTISCDNLDKAVDHYTNRLGYRLDMIVPADAPRAALLSKDGETIRLVSVPPPLGGGSEMGENKTLEKPRNDFPTADGPPAYARGSDWVVGRAGMEYRDLIPDRLGGKVIASHIRLTNGGEVPDYVHYHKVEFQMIYCKRGRIKVVYEDQGPPFWLDPGDCVLQPPEIRHRVLEVDASSEVVEIGMPAVHETWADHELKLPTEHLKPDRDFSGQRFVRHIGAGNTHIPVRDTGISSATNGLADVRVLRAGSDGNLPANYTSECEFTFYFVLKGNVKLLSNSDPEQQFIAGDAFLMKTGVEYSMRAQKNSEILCVKLYQRPMCGTLR